MNTKNTIIAGILATGILFSNNVNATEIKADAAENTPIVSAASAEVNEFAFTKAPESKEKKDTSVTLSWEALDGALGYIVSYGEISVEKSKGEVEFYDKETENLIEINETTIEGLKADTTYYFVVTAIDKNGSETKFSPELELKTLQANISSQEQKSENDSLKITQTEASFKNQIKITFNKALENSAEAIREFKILEKDSQIELNIEKITLGQDNMTLDLDLVGTLKTNSEYEITVIALNAQDGSNIEAGVEGMRSFTTPGELKEKEEESIIMENPIIEEPEVDLNAAPEKIEEIKDEVKKLPQTGAQEVIVLILALVLSGLVFIRKKA